MNEQVNVVAEAAPFCFGPVATLLSVTSGLESRGARVTYLASGPAAQLIGLSRPGAELIECRTADEQDVARYRQVLRQADVVITNTNPDFAKWSLQMGARTAVVDTLFWMWDRIDPQLASASPYVIQDFDGVEQQHRRTPGFEAATVVGPLIPPQALPVPFAERDRVLLVSFGGVECPLVDPDAPQMPELVLGPILKALAASDRFAEVLVCGGGRLAERLEEFELPPHFQVRCLSREQHVEAMRRAEAAILSPGLTSFFESLRARTPVFFLPPQNYSQVLQLRRYRQMEIGDHSLSWDDLGWTSDMQEYLPEEIAVAGVRECLDRFRSDSDAATELTDRMVRFFDAGEEPCQTDAYEGVCRRFSRDGPSRAAEAVLNAC
jgi:hypothetical protein